MVKRTLDWQTNIVVVNDALYTAIVGAENVDGMVERNTWDEATKNFAKNMTCGTTWILGGVAQNKKLVTLNQLKKLLMDQEGEDLIGTS